VGQQTSATVPITTMDATGAWLDRERPVLAGRYRAHLPGARAAVLARLWGALGREPVPGVAARHRDGDALVVTLADGRRLTGPATAAEPFAAGEAVTAGLRLALDGAAFDDPARLLTALGLPGTTDRLAAELDDSVANLALARAGQPAPVGRPVLPTLAGNPARAEQLVVDGHPLHPCCRTRLGLSAAEVLAYAPEHRPTVTLSMVDVPSGRWLTTGTGLPPRLPVHPWQRDHVLAGYGLAAGDGRLAARPLMSLRTLSAAGWHWKTAVDVQMTSAVRTVSPAAVHNGPAVSGLLATLAHRLPGFVPLREVAAGAVLVDGQPCRSLAVVQREAPHEGPDAVVLPLAALAARSPADGRPVVTEVVDTAYGGDARAFVADLAGLLLPPALTLLWLGVALEAHGQNTLVVLHRGRPARVLYRDVGGLRISPRRLAANGVEVPPLHGDIPTDDPDALRTKLFAAVLSTVVGELVAVLTAEYPVPAGVLWDEVAGAIRAAYADLPARADAEALGGGPLPVKATTVMRLAAEPLDDVWTTLPNPLAGLV
jgi:siderophore synthetase component